MWKAARGGEDLVELVATLTMMRMGEDRVRIVTGVFHGGRDEFWVRRHLPTDGSVSFANVTDRITTLGVWGPNSPQIVGALTDHDLGQAGSPYGSLVEVELRCGGCGVPATLFLISYVGDTGWEIYPPGDPPRRARRDPPPGDPPRRARSRGGGVDHDSPAVGRITAGGCIVSGDDHGNGCLGLGGRLLFGA